MSALLQAAGEDAAHHFGVGALLPLDGAEQVVNFWPRDEQRKVALERAILGTVLAAFAQLVAYSPPESESRA